MIHEFYRALARALACSFARNESLASRMYALPVLLLHHPLQLTVSRFNLYCAVMIQIVWRTADQCPSKPHPGMVVACMEELGIDAGRTTVVGDARVDMQMATASGVRGLGVSFGVENADALREAGAASVVESFSDLLGYFPHLQSNQASSTIAL